MIVKTIVAKIFKNLIGMLVTKHMIFWALELATKQSKNKVDDNVVALVKAAYEGDEVELKKSVEAILNQLNQK